MKVAKFDKEKRDAGEFVEYFKREFSYDQELCSAVMTAWINFNVMKNREADKEVIKEI